MTRKPGFARSLQVSLMGLVMGGGAIAVLNHPAQAQLVQDATLGADSSQISILNESELLAGIFEGSGISTSQSGDITLNATGLVQVSGQSSRVGNDINRNATGNSGNLIMTAHSLRVDDRAQLSANPPRGSLPPTPQGVKEYPKLPIQNPQRPSHHRSSGNPSASRRANYFELGVQSAISNKEAGNLTDPSFFMSLSSPLGGWGVSSPLGVSYFDSVRRLEVMR